MKRLNPELRYNLIPPEAYSLRVPNGKKSILEAKLDDIPVASKPRPAYARHRVRRGETLSIIAQKYRTSITAIVRANHIHRRNYIVAGQYLKIPQRGTVVYKTQKYQRPAATFSSTHVVRSGDSLWNIARKYGVTVKQIQKDNRMSNTRLQIGQVLKIPGPPVQITTGEGLKTYKVRRGDSPFRIAQRHNMTLERFLRLNQLTPRSKIYPGQQLLIE
jgi:membrane-bound lytic murein transglycosylase D